MKILQKLRALFSGNVNCEHKEIFIAGTKNGMQARYQCRECGREIDPQEQDKTYRPK